MRCYLFATFLLIFITSYVYSNELTRDKRCSNCCGPPPCCHCCGLPRCGFNFNLTDLLNFTFEPTVVTSTVPTPTIPTSTNKPTRPPLCLMCCGKPPCCNTCGLDIDSK